MASSFPLSQESVLPVPTPPPQLFTRSGNEAFDRPHTPVQSRFTSPTQTPQGSPSKRQFPPGANALPDVFENAMKLTPTPIETPSRSGRTQGTGSPNRNTVLIAEDREYNAEESVIHKETYAIAPGSPTRKSNKENTPPGFKSSKEAFHPQNQAAASRQELYQPREHATATVGKKSYETQRGLTAEEVEKLQKPNVKRLANVTQLCEYAEITETSCMGSG